MKFQKFLSEQTYTPEGLIEMPSHQKSNEINSVHIKTEFHYFYEEETQ